jgi:antitoxin component YwqK of YwqJK toxin-antitoxin module
VFTYHLATKPMRLKYTIIGLTLFFSGCHLFGQTNQVERLYFPFLDKESQSNVVVSVSADLYGGGQPCPVKYTNLTSNTNLFTHKEQELLEEVTIKYKNITTNSGPAGTVLVSLCKTNFIIMNRTNESWVARFQYTNSDAQEEVWFGSGISARFSTKDGNGYNVGIGSVGGGSMLRFSQVKQGLKNGLAVDFLNNKLQSYMHYTNDLVLGNYFMWNPQNGNLIVQAKFKEPYDMEKHRIQYPR